MAIWQWMLVVLVWTPLLSLIGLSVIPEMATAPWAVRKWLAAARMSLFGFFPALGGSLAAAAVWIGILRMQAFRSNESVFATFAERWSDVIFISLIGPAIAMIGIIILVIQHMPVADDDRAK